MKLNCSEENLYNLRGLGRAASSISRCVDRERNERDMCGTRRRGENSAAIGERNTTWQHNREVSAAHMAAQKRKGHEWRSLLEWVWGGSCWQCGPGEGPELLPFYAAFGPGPTFTVLRQTQLTFTEPPPYGTSQLRVRLCVYM